MELAKVRKYIADRPSARFTKAIVLAAGLAISPMLTTDADAEGPAIGKGDLCSLKKDDIIQIVPSMPEIIVAASIKLPEPVTPKIFIMGVTESEVRVAITDMSSAARYYDFDSMLHGNNPYRVISVAMGNTFIRGFGSDILRITFEGKSDDGAAMIRIAYFSRPHTLKCMKRMDPPYYSEVKDTELHANDLVYFANEGTALKVKKVDENGVKFSDGTRLDFGKPVTRGESVLKVEYNSEKGSADGAAIIHATAIRYDVSFEGMEKYFTVDPNESKGK